MALTDWIKKIDNTKKKTRSTILLGWKNKKTGDTLAIYSYGPRQFAAHVNLWQIDKSRNLGPGTGMTRNIATFDQAVAIATEYMETH